MASPLVSQGCSLAWRKPRRQSTQEAGLHWPALRDSGRGLSNRQEALISRCNRTCAWRWSLIVRHRSAEGNPASFAEHSSAAVAFALSLVHVFNRMALVLVDGAVATRTRSS